MMTKRVYLEMYKAETPESCEYIAFRCAGDHMPKPEQKDGKCKGFWCNIPTMPRLPAIRCTLCQFFEKGGSER